MWEAVLRYSAVLGPFDNLIRNSHNASFILKHDWTFGTGLWQECASYVTSAILEKVHKKSMTTPLWHHSSTLHWHHTQACYIILIQFTFMTTCLYTKPPLHASIISQGPLSPKWNHVSADASWGNDLEKRENRLWLSLVWLFTLACRLKLKYERSTCV